MVDFTAILPLMEFFQLIFALAGDPDYSPRIGRRLMIFHPAE
jgi:hypothetical protein